MNSRADAGSPSDSLAALDDECPRCNVELVTGKALAHPPRMMMIADAISYAARMVVCRKCPACGYSEKLP